jgi:FAD/FMN-containing dehydrogenase
MKSVMVSRHKVFHLLAVVKRLYQSIYIYSLHINPHDSGVGASGLLLGGGLSYLSPAHGFACDNYRSLDVVLPHGKLVTVTGTNQYSDLFRALKGGGSRFGIVTRFEVDAIRTGTAADKNWFGGTVTVCLNHTFI